MMLAEMVGGSRLDELTEDNRSLIFRHLHFGTQMEVYRPKVERFTVQVIMRTMQVALMRTDGRIDRALDISEIKEVRKWKTFNDFHQFIENTESKWRKIFSQFEKESQEDSKTCFTVFYGSEFTLKSLNLSADTVDAEKWLTGLELLRQETLAAHTPELIERWLRKQMYSVDQKKRSSISLKELKPLLPQMNFTVQARSFLQDKFVDIGATEDTLSFAQFHKFYNLLIFENQKMILDEFEKGSSAFNISDRDMPDSSSVVLNNFQMFLLNRQKESWAKHFYQVQKLMIIFISDTMRKTSDSQLTAGEFLSFLFSKENSIWDEKFSEINQLEMNNPLSHYWINSSHNTYLTGDQLRSESSTEAYVRCLRLGCRCVELDCHNGPGEPVIYHGNTITSKIKFKDAVNAINDHAFATSEYPVILSIEEHCNIKQQKKMAQILRDVFQDKLLTESLEPEAIQLPSPSHLKGKIIIKHRKIQESDQTIKHEEEKPNAVKRKLDSFRNIGRNNTERIQKANERSRTKEGELWIWDPIDEQFYKHDCVISENKLYYSVEMWQEDDYEDGSVLHLSEPWFHGRLAGGRQTAERLLHDFCKGRVTKDGTFLVRESDKFMRNYAISLWKQGKVQHYRIFWSSENGYISFYLTKELCFPSMCALIQHYRHNLVGYDHLNLYLTNFVPRSTFVPHLQKEWFYSNLSRGEAEDYLLKIPRDGAFLIRQRVEPGTFALSVRVEGRIEHYLIYRNDSTYVLADTYEFVSLEEMVNYFRAESFHRVKLRYPVTPKLVERFYMKSASSLEYEGDQDTEVSEDNPLGDRCKGVVDISKCNVVRKTKHARPMVVTLQNKETLRLIEFTSEISEQVDEWYKVFLNIIRTELSLENKRIAAMEDKNKIAVEMSDLVVYCQSIKRDTQDTTGDYSYREIRSIPDSKIPKEGNDTAELNRILEHNRKSLTRVYPRGDRIDSSNFDPCPSWKLGCQMVALNFQTADKFTQMNSALFSMNGGTGYVLKPEWMRDPTKKKTTKQNIRIQVIAARHLPSPDHIISPFVQFELWPYPRSTGGQAEDFSFKTTIVKGNGLNPVWLGPMNPPRCLEVDEPDLTFLRFVVFEEDTFSDAKFLAQATFPVRGIRSGYRSVPLKNGFSENLELASLLVYIDVQQMEETCGSSCPPMPRSLRK